MKLLKFRWEAQGLGRVREDQTGSGCSSQVELELEEKRKDFQYLNSAFLASDASIKYMKYK